MQRRTRLAKICTSVTGFCVAAREEVVKLRRRAGKLGNPCFRRAPDSISPSSFTLRRDTCSSAV